ncbi:hypothetical protein EYF80_062114 [Liparis tanakae]|uniref:Uncharacterized protein n=1 Tax=Liparis tanakae TaxID=230148 RepID=A0A4Z2EFR8_9TELE|nr:hypothetical protein EYF80_062114 [Liparis tanakae]
MKSFDDDEQALTSGLPASLEAVGQKVLQAAGKDPLGGGAPELRPHAQLTFGQMEEDEGKVWRKRRRMKMRRRMKVRRECVGGKEEDEGEEEEGVGQKTMTVKRREGVGQKRRMKARRKKVWGKRR